jgi:DNA-binding GntR family transcriptional regulator
MIEPLIRTMSSQLIVRIRNRILAGAYAPGSALRQDALASEFGTSKIPIREALVQLQSEGLIDIYPNCGFRVRPLAGSELDEVFRLRLQIEPTAVGAGAKLATAVDHDVARKALAVLNETLAAEDFAASGQLNRAFHLALVVPRLQPVAAEILGRLHTLAQRYVQAHLRPEGRIRRAAREHAALFKVWSAGEGKDAKELSLRHIAATRDDLAHGRVLSPLSRGATRKALRPLRELGSI